MLRDCVWLWPRVEFVLSFVFSVLRRFLHFVQNRVEMAAERVLHHGRRRILLVQSWDKGCWSGLSLHLAGAWQWGFRGRGHRAPLRRLSRCESWEYRSIRPRHLFGCMHGWLLP